MTARVVIDPALRGRVTPSVLGRLARAGLHVHRVGRAAYVHDDGAHRWLLVVTPAPELEARLAAHHLWLIGRGPIPALDRRREAVWLAERERLHVPWWYGVPGLSQPWRVA